MTARWAIEQSPYACPDNLEVVVKKLQGENTSFMDGLLRFSTMSELEKYLDVQYASIPELLDWNERKNGNKSSYGFASRYEKPNPDDDFIDLGALSRNVAMSIWKDAVEFDDFNKKFDEHWAKRKAEDPTLVDD
jgi:hypothetical protein